MPARQRETTTTEPSKINVGGIEVTPDEIKQAIDVLTAAKGIMVGQPLRTAKHPLASADYHAVANEQRVIDLDNLLRTKRAFIAAWSVSQPGSDAQARR